MSNLISPEDASKHFRKAERARASLSLSSFFFCVHEPHVCTRLGRQRTHFAYPPSPSSSCSRPSSRSPTRSLPLPARLRVLQAELTALEAELEDPSNPALQAREKNGGAAVDPGEMIRGLVDVRRRLEKVRRGREGRGRLVGVVLGTGVGGERSESEDEDEDEEQDEDEEDEEDYSQVPPPPPYLSRAEEQKFLQNADRLLSRILAAADADGNGITSEMCMCTITSHSL